MMMATSTDDCVNHNPNFLIDVNFDNDDDGLFGFNDGGRDDDMTIDMDSFFTILDEDLPPGDQSLLEFSGNSFYPSMDQIQESASAAHIGNNDDLHFRLDNGAATESSADTGETPEQVCFVSAPDVSFFNANGASFAKSNIEPGLKIMKTECYPSTQDCSRTYDISSGFPNQNPIDGMNYGMILTNEAAKGDLEDSHLRIDNKTTLESQVGVATMSASEIPMHDFCDSFLHDNYTFSQVDTGNTFDSSSAITDETSADPFCRGTKSESNGEPALLHGHQGTSRRASKEDAFGRLSFGFDIKDFAASSKAPYSGGQIGRPDDYQRGFASERKPTKPPINSLISCSRFGALLYKKEEEAVTQAANIKQDTFYGSNEVYGSSLSDNRAYSEADDDDDVCIIEDLSVPARVSAQAHPVSVHKKSVTSHMSTFFPGHIPPAPSYSQVGVTVNRVKVADERLIFEAAVQDLSQPKTEANPPEGILAVPLLRHQRIALSWMVQKETTSLQCSGGILADDQGLGKTVSTITLILTERASCARTTTQSAQKELETLDLDEEDDKLMKNGVSQKDIQSIPIKSRPSGGTLVVCPTSVLRQWGDELKNKVADKVKLSVCMYHGSNRTKDPYELASYDVVLTTYSIVSMEVPKSVAAKEMNDKKKLDADDRAAALGKKRKHSSKSEERRLKKEMEEGLLESSARPLARVNWFRVVLDEAQSIKNYKTQVAQACWGLRAKRRWCLSGTPIQNAVDDLYSYFRFLRYDPYSVYKSFCSMVKFPITKNPSNGYKKLQAVLKTIMLRRTKGTLLDGEPIINLPPKVVKLKKVEFSEEERDFYTRLEADSRAQFQAYAASGTVKQNYVNILLMLLRLRQSCDHPFLVQGYGSGSALKSSIHAARKLPREQQINLLNCLEASLAICGICSDPPEDASVSTCGHVFCNQCISERLTGDENQCPVKNCKTQLHISSVFSKAALKSCIEGSSEQAEGVKPSLASCFSSSKIRTALKLLQSLSKPRTPVPDDNSIESSVSDVGCSNKPSSTPSTSKSGLIDKAIVFSQWTSMLDLLEDGLKQCSLNYRRLDGTMSVPARDKAVKDFNTLPEVSVMIMSLKAASLGLNMVAACHVILLDLWWNPTTEDQAIDRAHRIGQTRPVTVVRLTVKDTVEDRILALQQKKRELVASAFGEDETGSRQTRLTVEDLNYLFMA